MSYFQLSTDQTDAVDGICNELVSSNPTDHAIAVLTGSAGTGKTTVIGEILNKIADIAPLTHIALCAATHRAADVLKKIVASRPCSYTSKTTTAHQLFKLRPTVSKTGKEMIKTAGTCSLKDGTVVVIDESSMIGDQFLKAIVKVVKKKKLKLLFVGDDYQLPPPSDKCSIFDGSLYTFKLTTIHRQLKDNPILDKATQFRDYIEGKLPFEPTLEMNINSKGEGIHVLPHSEFVTKFVERYMDYATGAQIDVPLCTYTNDSAINYNSMIRKAAYFLEDVIQPFYPGERLIANSVVMQDDKSILNNNEEVIVKEYIEAEAFDIPGYQVTLKGDYNKYMRSDIKRVFCAKTPAAADKILNEQKKLAKEANTKETWVEYYKIKNYIADLRPPFAGTTHKAQGGTFPAVFIDKLNINKCRDSHTRARLFYVALTRATTNVYINS